MPATVPLRLYRSSGEDIGVYPITQGIPYLEVCLHSRGAGGLELVTFERRKYWIFGQICIVYVEKYSRKYPA